MLSRILLCLSLYMYIYISIFYSYIFIQIYVKRMSEMCVVLLLCWFISWGKVHCVVHAGLKLIKWIWRVSNFCFFCTSLLSTVFGDVSHHYLLNYSNLFLYSTSFWCVWLFVVSYGCSPRLSLGRGSCMSSKYSITNPDHQPPLPVLILKS